MASGIVRDSASMCANIIVEAIKPVFVPDEIADARELIYEAVYAAIEMAFILRAREQRLEPSMN